MPIQAHPDKEQHTPEIMKARLSRGPGPSWDAGPSRLSLCHLHPPPSSTLTVSTHTQTRSSISTSLRYFYLLPMVRVCLLVCVSESSPGPGRQSCPLRCGTLLWSLHRGCCCPDWASTGGTSPTNTHSILLTTPCVLCVNKSRRSGSAPALVGFLCLG